jgi:putative thiamine transport system substrate-binding protein
MTLPPPVSRRHILQTLGAATTAAATGVLGSGPALSATPWETTVARARGGKVFFNAWGGSERTNAYLQWVAAQVSRGHGITLSHVKITDTAEAVKRIRNERQAGRSAGSVDMVWINGENFLTLKREGLLYGPFAESRPHYRWVDTENKPSTRTDFSEPV